MQVVLLSKISSYYYNRPQKIKVNRTEDVHKVFSYCSRMSGIPQEEMVIKFVRDGYTLKVVEGWTFEYYEMQENAVLYIESVKDLLEASQSTNMNQIENTRRLMELVKMKKEGLIDEDVISADPTQISIPGKGTKNKEDILKALFVAIRKGDADFGKFLATTKIEDVHLNTCDQDGWYPIHYAINYGNKSALKFIMEMSSNLNQSTTDGHTTLMLAANKKSPEIFRMIIDSKKSDVNKITKKGSILHFLILNEHKQFLPLLMDTAVNPYLKDSFGRQAVDLIQDNELKKKLIVRFEKDQSYAHLQKKPNSYKGCVYKTGKFFRNLKARYLELNMNQRSLIRYESRDDCPHKPIEIIPLRDIVGIEESGNKMFLQNGYHYFEIDCGQKILLATKTEEMTETWVKAIKKGIDFTIKYEEALKDLIFEKKNPMMLNQSSKMIDLDNTNAEIASPGIKVPELPRENLIGKIVKLENFEIKQPLGEGQFGKVYKVNCKLNSKTYAMKVLKKELVLQKGQLKYAQAEASILKKNNHPFLLSLYFSFQTPTNLYMVMDCCSSMNLKILIFKNGVFTDQEAKFYISEIILALESLHEQGVYHRDLKPDNILIATDGHLMLADFGLAKENVKRNEIANSFLGSKAYLSPEMVRGEGFTQASDIYGIGMILYEMLCGDLPFPLTTEEAVFNHIKSSQFQFPEDISNEGKDIMRKLLEKDPQKRIGTKSIDEIKRHSFFDGVDWDEIYEKKHEPPLYEPVIERRDIRAALKINDQDYDQDNVGFMRIQGWSFVRENEIEGNGGHINGN